MLFVQSSLYNIHVVTCLVEMSRLSQWKDCRAGQPAQQAAWMHSSSAHLRCCCCCSALYSSMHQIRQPQSSIHQRHQSIANQPQINYAARAVITRLLHDPQSPRVILPHLSVRRSWPFLHLFTTWLYLSLLYLVLHWPLTFNSSFVCTGAYESVLSLLRWWNSETVKGRA